MEDRPHVPTSTVVFGGAPRDMKACFRKWRDERTPTALGSPGSGSSAGSGAGLQRFRSLRVVPLNAALDAVRF